jgi:hypothetical protein
VHSTHAQIKLYADNKHGRPTWVKQQRGDSEMSNRVDAYVAGFFIGCLAMCFLMMAVPDKKTCEVSVMYRGGKVEVVRYGVLAKY